MGGTFLPALGLLVAVLATTYRGTGAILPPTDPAIFRTPCNDSVPCRHPEYDCVWDDWNCPDSAPYCTVCTKNACRSRVIAIDCLPTHRCLAKRPSQCINDDGTINDFCYQCIPDPCQISPTTKSMIYPDGGTLPCAGGYSCSHKFQCSNSSLDELCKECIPTCALVDCAPGYTCVDSAPCLTAPGICHAQCLHIDDCRVNGCARTDRCTAVQCVTTPCPWLCIPAVADCQDTGCPNVDEECRVVPCFKAPCPWLCLPKPVADCRDTGCAIVNEECRLVYCITAPCPWLCSPKPTPTPPPLKCPFGVAAALCYEEYGIYSKCPQYHYCNPNPRDRSRGACCPERDVTTTPPPIKCPYGRPGGKCYKQYNSDYTNCPPGHYCNIHPQYDDWGVCCPARDVACPKGMHCVQPSPYVPSGYYRDSKPSYDYKQCRQDMPCDDHFPPRYFCCPGKGAATGLKASAMITATLLIVLSYILP